jgi:hypothetical protein
MSVTVIIPTTCEQRRGATLRRALLSVLDQLPEGGCVLVVANGDRVDEKLVQMVKSFPRTRLERLQEASVARAQQHGRGVVTTEFFCFLDDDDEYLANALDVRVSRLRANSAVDVLVTNGLTRVDAFDSPRIEHPELAQADPLRALLRENWLASCAGTFRTSTVTPDLFDGRTCFFEWTLLAFKLATSRTVRFVDVPTYRVHSSPESASQSRAYREAELNVLSEVAKLDLPADVRGAIRQRLGKAERSLSTYLLRQGDWRRAIRHRVRSLGRAASQRFLAYADKLLRGRRHAPERRL